MWVYTWSRIVIDYNLVKRVPRTLALLPFTTLLLEPPALGADCQS